MRARFAALFVGCLISFSILTQVTTGSGSIQIADSATAQSIDPSTNLPVNRTVAFSANDATVYAWVKLANVPSPSHSAVWIWIGPNQREYSNFSNSIPDPGQGKTWSSYYLWAYINIAGHSPGQMQGTWEVDLYIDGTSYLALYFSIAASAVPIQPTEGFSWPTSVIPVYVQPNPSYAKTDVARAMAQWNFSQNWFQKTYALQQMPVWSLSLSNNSASPIRVSFNQTQSSSNWGWTNYHYYYDAGGKFTSVNCSISIVLSLSGGTLLNDIALQDNAEHELGHCLGLWHTAQGTDLMNHLSGSFTILRLPSTLNLFALYELSSAHLFNQVSSYYALLPSIGYAFAPLYSNSSTLVTTGRSSSQSTTSISSSASATSSTTSSSATISSTIVPSSSISTPTYVTSNQGSGIPEFPFQLVATMVLVVIIAASFLLIRRKNHGLNGRNEPQHGVMFSSETLNHEAVGGPAGKKGR